MRATMRIFVMSCLKGQVDSTKREALIAIGDHFVTFLDVRWEADVRHKDARFPRYIGAQIPGVARRRGKHRPLSDLVDVVNPGFFCFRRRLNRAHLARIHLLDALGNPVNVLLD